MNEGQGLVLGCSDHKIFGHQTQKWCRPLYTLLQKINNWHRSPTSSSMVLLFVAMQCSIMTEFLLILCISNNMINIKDVNMNNKMLFREFKRVRELCMNIYVTQVIHFFSATNATLIPTWTPKKTSFCCGFNRFEKQSEHFQNCSELIQSFDLNTFHIMWWLSLNI